MPTSPPPRSARGDAEAASAAYQTALAGARARAQGLAEENRQTLNAEIAKAKADADAEARKRHGGGRCPHRRDARRRPRAMWSRRRAEAAIAIVARLTGETVSAADAARAVEGGLSHGNAAANRNSGSLSVSFW